MDPIKIATVWLGGCSGCHMSFLDLDEFLIELAQKVQIVFSPIIDIKEYPVGVDVALVEGAICNEEHLEMARKVRARTRVLISFGDCAVTGNVSAIRNQLGLGNAENVLHRAYVELAGDGKGRMPKLDVVPRLLDRVMPLHEVVPVDYFLPACPPPAERIKSLLMQILEGQAPVLKGEEIRFG
jgi:NAD-reducing hydrogenase small subunit